MVAIAGVVGRVGEVAEADAHVAGERPGQGDGDGDAEDGVRDGEGIEVAIAKEEEAGGESPDEGDDGEDGVGQVGEREGKACGEGGETGTGDEALKAREEEVL